MGTIGVDIKTVKKVNQRKRAGDTDNAQKINNGLA
jgi:hypothetical protein